MSKEKFIKEDWKVGVGGNIFNEAGECIANPHCRRDNSRQQELDEENEANGVLISAAPDMYEALCEIQDLAERIVAYGWTQSTISVEKAEKILKALAKARGGQYQ